MLTCQQIVNPSTPKNDLSEDFEEELLISTPATTPPPPQEEVEAFAKAYASYAGIFLCSCPQEQGRMKKWKNDCLRKVQMFREAVSSNHNISYPPLHAWWKTYNEEVRKVLRNAQVKSIEDFSKKIKEIKNYFHCLKSRKSHQEHKLIELLDGTYSAPGMTDPAIEIEQTMLLLDSIDRQLRGFVSATPTLIF